MIIQTKDFILRPLRLSDAADIARNINDKVITRNTLTIPYPYTLKMAKAWLRKELREAKSGPGLMFAIEISDEDVGCISFHNLDGHKAELGYWLARQYWGRGIMTKAVKEITKYGFIELGLRRIQASVFPFNKASQRILVKAGYKFEGILRKNVVKQGRLLDECVYAKVK
ncbi:MAG: GNAT family N-acetyltransferase [Candidatus Buchananbacteria bacterium]